MLCAARKMVVSASAFIRSTQVSDDVGSKMEEKLKYALPGVIQGEQLCLGWDPDYLCQRRCFVLVFSQK